MSRFLRLIAVSVAGLSFLNACVTHPPVSYNQGTPQGQRPPSGAEIGSSVKKGEPTPIKVVVKNGDTIYTISQEYGVAIRDLITANRLDPPYYLKPGELIQLPPRRTHLVQRGDTLYGISRQYGSDIYSLAHVNNLAPPYSIRVGQQLMIPGSNGSAPVTAVITTPVAPPSAITQPASPPGPRISTPLPTPAGPPLPPPERPPVAEVPPAAAIPAPLEPITPVVKPKPADPEPEPQRQASAHIPMPAAPPAAPASRGGSGPKFAWPVQGKILSAYGPKNGGLHNDGINIAVRRGAEVKAAENGTVVYAGNELRGYGNLLLIRHADGWMTAYAHNDALKVAKGDRVNKGQAIAAAGATGNVSEPQVHFEIRRGSQAVDPAPLLGLTGT